MHYRRTTAVSNDVAMFGICSFGLVHIFIMDVCGRVWYCLASITKVYYSMWPSGWFQSNSHRQKSVWLPNSKVLSNLAEVKGALRWCNKKNMVYGCEYRLRWLQSCALCRRINRNMNMKNGFRKVFDVTLLNNLGSCIKLIRYGNETANAYEVLGVFYVLL
jgi:hypothetical protein